MNEYDVIIIGAGPAGLSAASHLKGKKVLLIDARKEPYKDIACAEWVPKLSIFAPYKISNTEYMKIMLGNDYLHLKTPGYIIDRERLQKDMLESLSCKVHLGERVIEVENDIVKTNYGTYIGHWIVGAYGPVGPMIKTHTHGYFMPAINVRVDINTTLNHTILYFSREILHGYAWCFPRGNEANCGVGARSRELKPLLYKWLKLLREMGIIRNTAYRKARSGLIPLSILQKPTFSRHILIGDAGGYTDPLTGAGIANAIETGKMAAFFIKRYKKDKNYSNISEILRLAGYLKRREKRRKIMESKWNNLKEAIEKSWISFYRE